jgi:hypothetical protein
MREFTINYLLTVFRGRLCQTSPSASQSITCRTVEEYRRSRAKLIILKLIQEVLGRTNRLLANSTELSPCYQSPAAVLLNQKSTSKEGTWE